MNKALITALSLGILLFLPSAQASRLDLSESSPELLSSFSPLMKQLSYKAEITRSKINLLTEKNRTVFANQLGLTCKTELERVIPKEHQDDAAAADSCCCIFLTTCLKISSKTLGNLAVNLVLDLSDGKLNGQGPAGPINYLESVVDIVSKALDEFQLN